MKRNSDKQVLDKIVRNLVKRKNIAGAVFYFSSKDNGLSDHRHCEVIFFAHCIEDAKDILKRMFQHQIDCSNQYLSVANPTNRHYDFYKDQNENNVSKWQRYLDALDDIELIEVPTNQFYKVGWADNDTI